MIFFSKISFWKGVWKSIPPDTQAPKNLPEPIGLIVELVCLHNLSKVLDPAPILLYLTNSSYLFGCISINSVLVLKICCKKFNLFSFSEPEPSISPSVLVQAPFLKAWSQTFLDGDRFDLKKFIKVHSPLLVFKSGVRPVGETTSSFFRLVAFTGVFSSCFLPQFQPVRSRLYRIG